MTKQNKSLPDFIANEDFTEDGYRSILRLARNRYSFEPFGTVSDKPHTLWRHDVDFSPHRALALARIEREIDVQTTYFFSLHSEFYNLLEKEIFELVQEITGMGHDLGLHFDPVFYGATESVERLESALRHEKLILENMFAISVSAFSWHNPAASGVLRFDDNRIVGMVNAYGKGITQKYHYCSDSNGLWRHERLRNLLESGEHKYLHALTHPAWWQSEPMNPRDKIVRSVGKRAEAILSRYDRLLQKHGRANVRK